jgi:6-pyruvoyltetrahydropterin/6-carboxytetrahydropterin synthase
MYIVQIMFEVRIEAGFAAAHRLVHYNGKCERLHGHNYKVRVWAEGRALGEGGMLVDFGILKKALSEILETLDHSDLNGIPQFADDPSAERIAKYIFDGMIASHPELPLSAIDVFETETSMARFRPDSK